MNPRIQELLDQSTHDILGVKQVDHKEFAELIVQECLDTIQRGIDNGGGANEDIVMAGKLALFYSYRNIQSRFGMGDYKDPEHPGVES